MWPLRTLLYENKRGGFAVEKTQLYKIGDAAALCSVSVKTLRYYDQIGLVMAEKNPETGYRYYRKEQLLRIQLIKRLKELNFALDEIQEFLSGSNMNFLEESIRAKIESIEIQMETLRALHSDAKAFLSRLNQRSTILSNRNPNMTPEEFSLNSLCVEQIPSKNVLSIRKIQKNYRNEEVNIDRWGELLELARQERAIPIGPITVAYHNGPLEQFYNNTCDYEVYMEVMGGEGSPHFRQTESYQAVTTVHVGGYDGLIKPCLLAMQWANENGYRIAGPMNDMFIVSPIDTRDEAEYLTKIIIPVEPAN